MIALHGLVTGVACTLLIFGMYKEAAIVLGITNMWAVFMWIWVKSKYGEVS